MTNINSIYSKTRPPKPLNFTDRYLNICFINYASFHNSILFYHSEKDYLLNILISSNYDCILNSLLVIISKLKENKKANNQMQLIR